jgi:hypothetical protein
VPETLPPTPALASMEETITNPKERQKTKPLALFTIPEDKVKTNPSLRLNILLLS